MYRTTPFFTTKSAAPTITVSAAPSTDVQSCSVPMSTNCLATKGLLVPSFTYGRGNKGSGGGGGRGGGRLNRTSVPQSAQLIGGGGPETCWTKQTRALGGETPLVTEETSMCLVDGVDVKNDGREVGTVLNNSSVCSPPPPPLLSPTPAERLELSLLLALLHDFSLSSAEEKDASGRIIGDRHSSNGEKNSTNTTASATGTTGSTSSGGSAACVRPTRHTTDNELIAPCVREWVKGMGVPFCDNSFSSSSFSSVQQTSKTGGCQRVLSGSSGPLVDRTWAAPSQPSTAIRGRPQPQPRHTNSNTNTNINNSSINPQAGRIYCLKHYNNVKDAAQHIFGLVAQSRGVELSQLYFEEGISDE